MWDIVRLSEARVQAHVALFTRNFGDFIYADRLHKSGAYSSLPESLSSLPRQVSQGLESPPPQLPLLSKRTALGSLTLAHGAWALPSGSFDLT